MWPPHQRPPHRPPRPTPSGERGEHHRGRPYREVRARRAGSGVGCWRGGRSTLGGKARRKDLRGGCERDSSGEERDIPLSLLRHPPPPPHSPRSRPPHPSLEHAKTLSLRVRSRQDRSDRSDKTSKINRRDKTSKINKRDKRDKRDRRDRNDRSGRSDRTRRSPSCGATCVLRCNGYSRR